MDAWKPACDAVTEALAHGIREFVVCAGARNAALIEALARAEAAGAARLWRHFEERGAAFFALGRTMATGRPCAVVTTSGTAAAELLPAMVEARYQGRPLVALTADRPARFRGSGAPQTIDQPGLFGTHAGGGDLATWDRRSPWHWNLELEEDFEIAAAPAFSTGDPAPSVWPRLAVGDLARWLRDDIYRGLVLIIGGLEPDDREDVFHFAMALGVPVVAEATSGLREILAPLVLADPDRELRALMPGKILRLGEVPSGRFWRDLEDLPQVDVWNVTRSGFPGLARPSSLTTGEIGRVVRALGDMEETGDVLEHLRATSRRRAAIEELLEAHPESEPGLLRTLSRYAAFGTSVFLGNSLPIREWNLFAQWDRPISRLRANRGANGIDGQVSTWLGATAEETDAWCVIGDLTALYDLAAPALLDQVEKQGRTLVVINNGGGRIFDRLPRLAKMAARARELMLQPHQANLEAWAALWGMRHLRLASEEDFDRLEPGPEPLLVELVPHPGETTRFWQGWTRLG